MLRLSKAQQVPVFVHNTPLLTFRRSALHGSVLLPSLAYGSPYASIPYIGGGGDNTILYLVTLYREKENKFRVARNAFEVSFYVSSPALHTLATQLILNGMGALNVGTSYSGVSYALFKNAIFNERERSFVAYARPDNIVVDVEGTKIKVTGEGVPLLARFVASFDKAHLLAKAIIDKLPTTDMLASMSPDTAQVRSILKRIEKTGLSNITLAEVVALLVHYALNVIGGKPSFSTENGEVLVSGVPLNTVFPEASDSSRQWIDTLRKAVSTAITSILSKAGSTEYIAESIAKSIRKKHVKQVLRKTSRASTIATAAVLLSLKIYRFELNNDDTISVRKRNLSPDDMLMLKYLGCEDEDVLYRCDERIVHKLASVLPNKLRQDEIATPLTPRFLRSEDFRYLFLQEIAQAVGVDPESIGVRYVALKPSIAGGAFDENIKIADFETTKVEGNTTRVFAKVLSDDVKELVALEVLPYPYIKIHIVIPEGTDIYGAKWVASRVIGEFIGISEDKIASIRRSLDVIETLTAVSKVGSMFIGENGSKNYGFWYSLAKSNIIDKLDISTLKKVTFERDIYMPLYDNLVIVNMDASTVSFKVRHISKEVMPEIKSALSRGCSFGDNTIVCRENTQRGTAHIRSRDDLIEAVLRASDDPVTLKLLNRLRDNNEEIVITTDDLVKATQLGELTDYLIYASLTSTGKSLVKTAEIMYVLYVLRTILLATMKYNMTHI